MEPVTPRLAATLLLVRDDPLRVLMVRRAARGAFASASVFPGGMVEPDDGDDAWLPFVAGATHLSRTERALRIAALRETWEETGLLPLAGADPALPRTSLRDALSAAGGRLPLDRMVPFAHWITPEAASRRYDTHFFLMAATDAHEPLCDGREIVASGWHDPADVDPAAPFPTRLNLQRLAESASVAQALAAARHRAPFTVLPEVTREGGEMVVTIPRAAGYAVCEDRRPDGPLV